MTSPDSPPVRRALLTGASSGIGAALAKELARRQISLWLGARRTDRLAAVVDEIRAAGGTATAVALDVADAHACARAVVAVDDDAGGLDVVIANAGVGGKSTSIWEIDVDDAAGTIATNFTGALATILPLLPRMRSRGRGHIVGISSLAADLSQPMAPVYGATKAAFSFFLDSVAPELELAGINVTIVHPGFVRSEMTDKNKFDMPFLVETDRAARLIADAIDARARWLRFPWQLSTVMGAAGMVPREMRAAVVRRFGPPPPK
ncbi:MAG: SDR family NAD(P)-dependent oxidoreductase [Deltaproteobacteria bacterium]|nr:SDR family NAD(P)-dependent oxidoreductase [Deltaproteobacteria bacterium]